MELEPVSIFALLFLLIISQTSCSIEVLNYEFKANEIFHAYHINNDDDDHAITLSLVNGTIYSSSLSQLPSDINDLWFDQSELDNIEDGALCSSSQIREITFFRNGLPQLTGGMFANCKNLRSIVYDRNVVDGPKLFSDDAFAGLTTLRALAISTVEQIPHVPKTLFKGLKNLRVFRIIWSNLATVESGTFDDLVSLEILDLCQNELETLDVALFSKLTQLQELNLSRNKLTQIPNGQLATLHDLGKLDISRNRLENFPWNDLFSFSKLRKFDFYNNKVKNLTAEVDLVKIVKTHWPYLRRMEYHQETMSCDELIAITTTIWKFRRTIEMPNTGCEDQWREYRKLQQLEKEQQNQQH